jgi:cytochrome c5
MAIIAPLFRPLSGRYRSKEEIVVINVFKLCLVALGLATVVLVSAGQVEDGIAERIKPVGEVCIEGQECAVATSVTAAASGPRSGQEVYDAACMACHATGAGGAPVVGDTVAWADRIGKGLEALYVSGIEGVPGTGMMAMGTCMSCSEDEIRTAVDHMVENSQ